MYAYLATRLIIVSVYQLLSIEAVVRELNTESFINILRHSGKYEV
jgi:hypothetical protein